MVEGGELGFVEALDDREDGAVDEADVEVRVGAEKLRDAVVVGAGEVFDVECAALDVAEQRYECVRAEVAGEEVIGLDEDRGGDDASLPCVCEQLGAGAVIPVAAVECADDDAGVDDQRNGGGS
jgi:hypothetical protein